MAPSPQVKPNYFDIEYHIPPNRTIHFPILIPQDFLIHMLFCGGSSFSWEPVTNKSTGWGAVALVQQWLCISFSVQSPVLPKSKQRQTNKKSQQYYCHPWIKHCFELFATSHCLIIAHLNPRTCPRQDMIIVVWFYRLEEGGLQ